MPNSRSHSGVCALLLALAMGSCGGDDTASGGAGQGGAGQGGGHSGPAAEATAGCVEACDDQIGAGCSGTTEMYRPFCVSRCELTTELILEACLDELVALQACRASLVWECDQFGGSQPTTTCATESIACRDCMDGTLCDAAALESRDAGT